MMPYRINGWFVRHEKHISRPLLIFCFVFTFVSMYDRQHLHKINDAKEKIAVVSFQARFRENTFTPEEKQIICDNWHDAGFDAHGEKCPE